MEGIKSIVNSEGLTCVDIGTGKNLFSFGPSPSCPLSIDTQIQDLETTVKYEELNNAFKKQNNKNKKEKEKKKIMELLELYERFQTENIEKSFDKQMDEILEKDELVQAAKEYNQRLNLLEDNVRKEHLKLDVERVLTVETQNEVNKIRKTIREATYKLNDKCNIIKAHLELADTFEEKQAILKSYNVIDEKGKLNILSQEEENVEEIHKKIADEINEKLEISEEKTRKDKKVWKK